MQNATVRLELFSLLVGTENGGHHVPYCCCMICVLYMISDISYSELVAGSK